VKEKWAGNSESASTGEEPGPLGGMRCRGPFRGNSRPVNAIAGGRIGHHRVELALGRLCVLMSVELLVVDAAIAQLDKAGDALRPVKRGGCSTFVGGPASEP